MKKTKIICTIGPSVSTKEKMCLLIKNGMDIARFNFSHGSHEEQKQRLDLLKEAREELGVPVAALLDTKGPEIRTGVVKGGGRILLEDGAPYIITTRDTECDGQVCSVNYPDLHKEIQPGDRILIDDGLIELEVLDVQGQDIHCQVKNGGELSSRKGVNLPNVQTKLPAITRQDREDILFGIEQGFDFIAASFVRSADAICQIRDILREKNSDMNVIAKIENGEGLENLDEIIQASDGIMIARGDLGVEIPPEKVPYIQKRMIRKCNRACKPVITATQMLDSMMRNPRPTRAEVTDVSNAVYEGTDVVMLSGETAAGKYPIESLKMMVHIVEEAESHLNYEFYRDRKVGVKEAQNISNSVCYASVATADELQAAAIITPSISGFTACMLSKWRPRNPIIGLSPDWAAVRRMKIYWGVTPYHAKRAQSTDILIYSSLELLKEKDVIREGDLVVVTAGIVSYSRQGEAATHTNIMRVVEVD